MATNDYAEIRHKIRSGDLLGWTHTELKTWRDLKIWFVRLFTRSEYSHVGTAWCVGERVFVIEAVMPLVRNFPLSKLGDFYWLPLNAPWKPSTEALALDYIGDEYSQRQAMQAPFEKPPADRLWECAELACTIAAADGINLGNVYTPSATMKEAKRLGYVETLVINPSK